MGSCRTSYWLRRLLVDLLSAARDIRATGLWHGWDVDSAQKVGTSDMFWKGVWGWSCQRLIWYSWKRYTNVPKSLTASLEVKTGSETGSQSLETQWHRYAISFFPLLAKSLFIHLVEFCHLSLNEVECGIKMLWYKEQVFVAVDSQTAMGIHILYIYNSWMDKSSLPVDHHCC